MRSEQRKAMLDKLDAERRGNQKKKEVCVKAEEPQP